MSHPDDIVLWPDGTTATVEGVDRGEMNHMSDDYEMFAPEDCPGCRGGDKVPAFEHFECPVCGAEWADEEPDFEVIDDADD